MSYQRRKQSGALASVSSRKLLKATKIEIVDGGRILIPLEIEDILQSLHPLEKLKNTTEQFPIENLNIENVNVENCGNIPQNVSQNVPQNVPQNIVEEDCMAVCEGITFTETKLSAL